MKIVKLEARNFGSYKHLVFEMRDKGLTLIRGPTGAGKSTLCDLAPWALFGQTAKNGGVDEIRSWNTEDETSTKCTINCNEIFITITRVRGNKNDLFYVANGSITRGKDMADTQKQINILLGFDAELYLAGAYFHEFSQTAKFFTTTAKNRRAICEQLVDLSLAKKLQLNLAENKKLTTSTLDNYNSKISSLDNSFQFITNSYTSLTNQAKAWNEEKRQRLVSLQAKHNTFEDSQKQLIASLEKKSKAFNEDKLQQIQSLKEAILAAEFMIKPDSYLDKHKNDICPECGSTNSKHVHERVMSDNAKKDFINSQRLLKSAELAENPFLPQANAEKQRTNTYQEQLKHLKAEVNPYDLQLAEVKTKLINLQDELTVLKANKQSHLTELSDIQQLLEVITIFRSTLIRTTIERIQNNTNRMLTQFFDAEIKVDFEVQADSDKLEVEILKDGNKCVFTQLSKGQRQLLKLCFGIAVMQSVQEHHGVSFNALWFDEATDGLSSDFKVKAYQLLKSLETQYPNIYLVEHSSELKAMIDEQIEVTNESGVSTLHAH